MITPKIFSHPTTIARGEMTPLNVTGDRITISLRNTLSGWTKFFVFDYFPICFGLFHFSSYFFSALACIFTFCSCIGTSGMY